MKLERRTVEKPWGRTELPAIFGNPDKRQIGEIWFEASDGRELPLLVKYIFTSERLSVQVHPDDVQAAARGLPRGKTECWYILDAEPGARLGLGLKAPVGPEELRAAALDGSIEELIDWRPVTSGDFFYVPANTVHAIGAGISLIEVQQQSDTTYRLYDYGRPRELHLDDGVDVSKREPYPTELAKMAVGGSNEILVSSDHFTVIRADRLDALGHLLQREAMLIPLCGTVSAGNESAAAGDCLLIAAGERIQASDDSSFLIAFSGPLERSGGA